jgi:hypothetical protein
VCLVSQHRMRTVAHGRTRPLAALVPFYKIFLPVLNLNLEKFSNLGDAIDYKQNDIGAFVGEVLELLEATGGKNAFQNIKFTVPLCECLALLLSCLRIKAFGTIRSWCFCCSAHRRTLLGPLRRMRAIGNVCTQACVPGWLGVMVH